MDFCLFFCVVWLGPLGGDGEGEPTILWCVYGKPHDLSVREQKSSSPRKTQVLSLHLFSGSKSALHHLVAKLNPVWAQWGVSA